MCGLDVPSRCLPRDGEGRRCRALFYTLLFYATFAGLGAGGGYLAGGTWESAKVTNTTLELSPLYETEVGCVEPRLCCARTSCPDLVSPDKAACADAEGAEIDAQCSVAGDGTGVGRYLECCARSSYTEVEYAAPLLRVDWKPAGAPFSTAYVYTDRRSTNRSEARRAGEELRAQYPRGAVGHYWGYRTPVENPEMELGEEGWDRLPLAVTMIVCSALSLAVACTCHNACRPHFLCCLYDAPMCASRCAACARACFCICCPTCCTGCLVCGRGCCHACCDAGNTLAKAGVDTGLAVGAVGAASTVAACKHMGDEVGRQRAERRQVVQAYLDQEKRNRITRYYMRNPDRMRAENSTARIEADARRDAGENLGAVEKGANAV